MQIDGNGRVGGPKGPATSSRSTHARSAFSLGIGEEAGSPAPLRAAPAVASLEAMLSLQEIVDPAERRRRAVKRGHRLLDELDGLKLALLDGAVTRSDLARLTGLIADQRESSGDPGLDEVLSQIDVRVAVELAKIQRRLP
jgi:hypothetical protein